MTHPITGKRRGWTFRLIGHVGCKANIPSGNLGNLVSASIATVRLRMSTPRAVLRHAMKRRCHDSDPDDIRREGIRMADVARLRPSVLVRLDAPLAEPNKSDP